MPQFTRESIDELEEYLERCRLRGKQVAMVPDEHYASDYVNADGCGCVIGLTCRFFNLTPFEVEHPIRMAKQDSSACFELIKLNDEGKFVEANSRLIAALRKVSKDQG